MANRGPPLSRNIKSWVSNDFGFSSFFGRNILSPKTLFRGPSCYPSFCYRFPSLASSSVVIPLLFVLSVPGTDKLREKPAAIGGFF